MALIKCSECGKEISDKASACPGCGAPIVTKEKIKQEIVDTITSQDETAKRKKIFVALVIILAFLVGIFYTQSSKLSGNDKIAYEIFVKGAKQFKDPSSVKIISGKMNLDKDTLYLEISATNSFGATLTEKYEFGGSALYFSSVKVKKIDYIPVGGSTFNVDKVNKAYQNSLK